jgi:hypothetical protein
MADHFTTRLLLPYPDIDDPADVPADMQQLAERLDVLIPAGSGAGLVLNRASVLDVGMPGQVRAGRQLALADFTALGLTAPLGLWNLSDLTDASGNGRALTNKGAVTFAAGINGAANTAAQFTGSSAQALYLADTGAADPLRIRTGSWGCWFRTGKRGTDQILLSKIGASLQQGVFTLNVTSGNTVAAGYGYTALAFGGAAGIDYGILGAVSDVADDRWHLAVATQDATMLRIYVDGVLEATGVSLGLMFAGSGPLNVGARSADGANPTSLPHYGRVDEAWVTADVLSDDQVRNLYCARLPHGYGVVPSDVKVNVTRRRRGSAWAVADFPTQPLRLHNFTGAVPAFYADEGSHNQPLVWQGGTSFDGCVGADGRAQTALTLTAGNLGSTDAGLPAALTPRSYGVWFKTTSTGPALGVMGWGASSNARIGIASGVLFCDSAGDRMTGPLVNDGSWHLVVVVEDNAPVDGVRRRLYLDGRLVVGSATLNAITLAGANAFGVGKDGLAGNQFTGQLDGVFVCGYALTTAQVLTLWAKGSQALSSSPKNPGDHVEAWDASSVLATFDTLESSWQVDLGVSA